MVYSTHYQYFMQGDGFPDDLDLAATIQIPRFGVGQKIFRRYTLQKVIGRGGMGVVWLAQDAYLDSLVALKVLPDTLLHDSASLDSLKRETKMGLSLAHPNIVRIYDFQHDESSAAISMEYVDGGTLSDLRIKRPDKIFNPQDLTDWLEALFDGLDYAHTRKQIVHRDLKPRNLMLTSRGELKIADFGISRCISDSVTLLTGMIGSSGTPPYISPQQWDGERPTPLDDIYSLGATLYELLSSKPPLLGVVDWHQVHHRVAPPISQRRIEFGIKGADPIPQHWEETVAACLAKDPAKRPQTIRELEGRLLVDNLESTTTLGKLPGAPPQETPAPVAESNLEKPVEISLRDTSSGLAEISSSPLPARNPAIPVMQAGEPGATSQAKLPADSSFERPVNDPVAATSQAVADNAARTAHPSQPKWVRMLRDAFSDKQGKIPLLVGLGVAAILLILLISLPNRTPRDLVIPAPSSAAFGDLTVESDPIGATIRLNEGEPLKAPHTYSNLKFGRHRIVASLEGYLATEKELEFKEGDFSKVILTLAKDPNFAKHLAAPSFAELSVRSEPPGASILVDGNPPGKLPDTFTELALGKHQLTATLEGYEPIQQELKIDVPNPEPLVIGLKPFGNLTIESEPPGAMIALDGGTPVKAPNTFSDVTFGRHKLSASLEGYLTAQQELDLKKGDSQKIVLKLAKKPPSFAKLSVRSEPPGASILVDGNPPDKPPDTFTRLALGKHQLAATLEGYEPIQQELKIDVPNPEPLVIGLKPFGNLTIESEPPGAMIALDGGTPVKAPNTFSDVTFGRHKLSASLEGYLTAQQELDLKKGDSQKIVLKLAKKPPSFAKLSVRSEPPGASILVDGNPPDKPPDTFSKLALGKHQLTATLEGYEPVQQELKIDLPNPEPLVIGLKPFGNLTIESEPPGAMIALDGGTPVKAPNTFSNVKFGRHTLSASLEGYLTAQQELDLKKGDSQKIALKLAKKPPSFAKLSVRSEPPGASILVDGNPPDKPPDTFTKLALGKHQLTATLEGYEPIQQELKIDVPNPEPLVIGLKPFGDLTIESEPPGAMIALDGGTPVKAPNTFSNVKFGRHTLSASLEGYLTAQQELDLKKGDSQKIALKLAKKPPTFAKLSVRSEPPGASILVDGNPPDKPPDTFTKLALGKHQLTATLEGYEPVQQELKIDVPNPEPLVIGLKPFGNLTIESEPPGAMIALDGEPPVKAPNTFSNVKFGRHTLSASLEGYLTAQQELDLKKGDSQKIVLKLAKKPPSFAKLSVRSEPPGASILVDGNPPDKPPDTFTKLALGKHQLTATLEGYEPVQQELKIDLPNPEPLVIGLKPFGDLTIESEPSGAMIALDGGTPVKAPNTFSNVKFGRHTLSASLEGYLTAQQELDLKKGDSQKIALKLAKKPPSFAKLSVRSEPPGASILVDGNPPDMPPDTFTKLALGKHQLTATLENYESVRQELKIDTANPDPLIIPLKHTQSFLRLQELVDQINSSKSAPDSPQHLNACVKYLQHLYLKGFPPSPELPPEELEKELEKIIERVRAHQSLLKPSLSRQEFQKYEEPIRVAAAQLGSLQALLMLAENEKEPSKKFKLFQDAALKNSPDAMMMLGIFSAKGVGEAAGKPNFEKALDWLKRASDAGNREAAAYYYDCFLFGDTTKKRSENDQKAAVESLEVLAKQGEAHAAVVLGEWSRRRASVAADSATRLKFYREADDWWKMAKGPREWRACFYLGALREMGSLNDDGKPTDADLKEARALYEEGASNEDVMCMFQLGRFIWDQSGGSRNSDQKKEALRYIRNAAVAGSEPAKTWLAKHADAR